MLKLIFIFKRTEIVIQCSINETMKDICNMFASKIKIDINEIYFTYGKIMINQELKIEQIINEQDKKINIMKILVFENIKSNNYIKGVICPECKGNILINIDDYHINLINCKNGHNIKNLSLNQYQDSQNIDISKIICDICKILNNKNNNELYKCLTCNYSLCPLCKLQHDKSHIIINYDNINYICNKHNERYIKYCKECNENICIKCEIEHKNHIMINYIDILPNNNNLNKIYELREYIDKLIKEIKDIEKKFNNVIDNIVLYYNICKDIINNKNRNYQIIHNINEFINYNNNIIKDIKEIINENNINNKLKNIMKMHYQMNNINYIIAKIDIKEDDINNNIRIMNSFEEFKRVYEEEDRYDDFMYENEDEIKENCILKINNKKIPFSYFHSFNQKGIYTIKYSFTNNLTKADYIFYRCNSLISIDLSNFNGQNITNISDMFNDCNSLSILNLSNFNTQNVTTMRNLFAWCCVITNIDLSSFNIDKVTDISYMFFNCNSLINVCLSNFNTKNVRDMSCMFLGCNSLTSIDLSTFKNHKVIDMSYMFSDCNSLINIDLSNFEPQIGIYMKSIFSGCNSLIL